MIRNRTHARFVARLLGGASLALVSAPLMAQDAEPEETPADSQAQSDPNTIIVTGIRAAIEGATNEKRNSDQIKDVIDAEDIGELPDNNVAEALQRVTGVQINRSQGEGDDIAVRGFSQNRVEINGQSQIGASADGNVSLSAIPSEAFKSIEVIKTPAADEIEGALGAIVRFNTRQPLDRNGLTLSASVDGQYSERADAWTPQFNALVANSWEYGDGAEIGVLLSYTRKDRRLREDFYEIRGYEAVSGLGDLDGDGTPDELIEYDDNGVIADLQDGAYIPTQTIFRVTEQDRMSENWTGAFQWRPTDGLELYANGSYNINRNDDLQYQTVARLNNATSPDGRGGFVIDSNYRDNLNAVVTDDRTIESAFLGFTRGNGRPAGVGFGISGASNPPQRDIFTSQAGIIWDANDDLQIEVQAAYGKGDRFQRYINPTSGIGGTDRPFFFYDLGAGTDIPTFVPLATAVDGEPVTAFSDAARYDFTDPGIYRLANFSVNDDTENIRERAARIDVDYDINAGPLASIEFGARVAQIEGDRSRLRARDANGDADGTLGDTQFTTLQENEPGLVIGLPFDDFFDGASGDFPNFFLIPDPNYFVANYDDILSRYNIVLSPDESFGYEGERTTYAGYVKANFDFELGAVPVFGNVGVRYVKTDRTISGPSPRLDAVQGDPDPFTFRTESLSYDNWLPSLNIVSQPLEDFYVRFGAARAMARPDLQDASPLLLVSDSFDSARGGNPLLQPEEVNQVDLSLEYYYGDSNLLAVALFYKDFAERIEDGIGRVCLPIGPDQPADTTPGTDGCLDGQDLIRVQQPVNVGGAAVKGLEVSWQQSLDFLPGLLSGFGFIANYTYADAGGAGFSATGLELPVQELSEHSYNLIGYYEKGPVAFRAAYNWRSEFYDERTQTNQASFRQPYGQLDASASFDITNKIQLSFEAINILNEPEEFYQEIEERPLGYRLSDRRFLIGIRVRN